MCLCVCISIFIYNIHKNSLPSRILIILLSPLRTLLHTTVVHPKEKNVSNLLNAPSSGNTMLILSEYWSASSLLCSSGMALNILYGHNNILGVVMYNKCRPWNNLVAEVESLLQSMDVKDHQLSGTTCSQWYCRQHQSKSLQVVMCKERTNISFKITLAVTTCPSFSIFSIVPVGKNGKITRNDLTRYLHITTIIIMFDYKIVAQVAVVCQNWRE